MNQSISQPTNHQPNKPSMNERVQLISQPANHQTIDQSINQLIS